MASSRLLIVLIVLFLVVRHAVASEAVTKAAKAFVASHEKRIRPLDIASNEAWWVANTTGDKAAFKKKVEAQNKIDEALSDKVKFAELKKLHGQRKDIDDAETRRAIGVLHLLYLEKQLDGPTLRQMAELSSAVEEKFNTFRAKDGEKELTDNQVREILLKSSDSKRLQAVWESSKAVGAEVEKDLKKLVKLRNEAAAKLGFKNFQQMQLELNEQTPAGVLKLFDELDELTREPFLAAKKEIDARLAKRYKAEPADLMPWHYHDPFFQDTPRVFDADLDEPFRKADIERMCSEFFKGIGLPIDKVLAKSDLKEKKGKSQHAFCTDIDREGDVRVLANIVPNHQWASTMLHELGHAVYSTTGDNIPKALPYALRSEAHILATEGVAMMFERLSNRSSFLKEMGVEVKDAKAYDEAASQAMRYRLLIFSRWCQVMLRFEKGMYEDPEQDLNALWWKLVEKYQGLKKPAGRSAPDYAAKIHIVVAPVYYHNYMMGELFASQLHHAIAREVYKGESPDRVIYAGNKEVGEFMRKKVFAPGRTLDWNGLAKHATGAELNAKAFAADFKAK
ncbi:MAG: M2 family metallopeptidase [Gemmataceae bacterium]|nr:M2 family metallopeptidase [Gemmataceae bacterium]